MRRFLAGGFPVACGALVGAMVALSQSFSWWQGALVGGIIAYLAVDLRETVNAVPRVWERIQADWQKMDQGARYSTLNTFLPPTILISALLILISSVIISELNGTDPDIAMIGPLPVLNLTYVLIGIVIFFTLPLVGRVETEGPKGEPTRIGVARAFNPRKFYLDYLPSFWLETLVKMLSGLVSLVMAIPAGIGAVIRGILRYVCLFFVEIHSSRRQVASADAAIFAMVGYITGHLWLAFIGGLIWGGLHLSYQQPIHDRLQEWFESLFPAPRIQEQVSTV